jgi:hypothetical protein
VENEKNVGPPYLQQKHSTDAFILLQKATIQRFRERWEKIKESARRKRSAKAAEGDRGDSVKETIPEEPELE